MQQKKYPMIPIIAIILEVVAVILLLTLVPIAIWQFSEAVKSWAGGQPTQFGMPSPAIKGFFPRLLTFFQPTIFLVIGIAVPAFMWAIASALKAIRDIEFNTRVGNAAAVAANQSAAETQRDTGRMAINENPEHPAE